MRNRLKYMPYMKRLSGSSNDRFAERVHYYRLHQPLWVVWVLEMVSPKQGARANVVTGCGLSAGMRGFCKIQYRLSPPRFRAAPYIAQSTGFTSTGAQDGFPIVLPVL